MTQDSAEGPSEEATRLMNDIDALVYPICLKTYPISTLIDRALRRERERTIEDCAKICDLDPDNDSEGSRYPHERIADKIRAMREKEENAKETR